MAARLLVAFVTGLLFASGITLSGMMLPQNVLGFLDVTHWNPQLLLVMVGAVAVYSVAWRLIRRRPKPVLGDKFENPPGRPISLQLIVGASIFGLGWGLSGFCGGPAIVSLAAGNRLSFVFVAAMLLGILLRLRTAGWLSQPPTPTHAAADAQSTRSLPTL